jgi:hypothetical protein
MPYFFLRDAEILFNFAILLAVRIRLAPSFAKDSAHALPIPALAPVISTILFDKLIILIL